MKNMDSQLFIPSSYSSVSLWATSETDALCQQQHACQAHT